MNGYGAPEEALIYGVPASLWATWSQFTKDKYMQQYNADVSNCFTHGDGRTTCYNKDTGDWEMLAYTYTYGVDEVINGESEQLVTDVKEFYEEGKEDIEEFFDDTLDTAKQAANTALILGALAGLALLSRGR